MELFIATVPYEKVCPPIAPVRLAFRETCLAMWEHLGFEPVLLFGMGHSWQRERRIQAELQAQGSIYLSTSDDVFPDIGTFSQERGIDLMESHPTFAQLSCLPYNETIVPWTGRPDAENDNWVMEHVSVGPLTFHRKGAMLDWPPMREGPGYDGIQGEYLRSHGWRVGYIRNMFCTHLGKGLSSVW